MHKLEKTLRIWNSSQSNLLEKATIVRTFALSQIWYVSNFIQFSKKEIKEINTLIFNFIWSSKRDRVRRGVVIRTLKQGGMNVVCLEAKLKANLMSYLGQIIRSYEEPEYWCSLYWLKFIIGPKRMKNFNIIPGMGEKEKPPVFYSEVIKCYEEIKKIVSRDMLNKLQLISVKELYETYRKKFEAKSKFEYTVSEIDSIDIHKNVINKNLMSELSSFNFLVLNNALYTADKFKYTRKNRKLKKCVFCNVKDETVEHVFTECEVTMRWYDVFCEKINIASIENNKKKEIIFLLGNDVGKVEKISIFKFAIWKTRNKIKYDKINGDVVFWKLLSFYEKLFSLRQLESVEDRIAAS